MKLTKEVQAQARRLMRLCIAADGILQEENIRTIADEIAERKPRNYVALLSAFTELVRLAQRQRTATVTGAVPFTEEEKAAIRAKLDSRQNGLSYEWHTDPDLIGGFTVKVGDNVTDASVLAKIKQLSEI